jgi:hypothetical protein
MTFGQYGKPKQCQNNCGQEIAWDKQAGYFINTSNSQRHDCPKWEKKSSFTPNSGGGAAQQSVTVDLGLQEQLTRVENKVDKLEQMLSMANWLIEKVAKKDGVDDLIENDK